MTTTPTDSPPAGAARGRGAARPHPVTGRVSSLTYVLLCALLLFALGPLVLFAFSSLKTQSELATSPLSFPTSLRWSNFATAWEQANMGAGLLNSLIVVVGTVAGVCVIAGCAAYAMARLDLPGSGTFITYLLVSSSLPTQMFLVPLFYLWTKLNLYDSLFGLIVIYWGLFSPFATLLLRSFMITIPREFEEAARMDGAGELRVLFQVVLPNALPGFLTIALVTALSAYNEFLIAVTFIQDSSLLPVSTTFFTFQQGFTQDYTLIGAAGMIMVLPMLLLFLALQRRFIEGVSSSGLGGA
ncbi:MAG: raffinose/stachyose/melibiose transport system permease protein [Pseudonocardiales bacterium]|jgi:raffinose/stachyose/melibiose transport system permease protein|nr:transporter permease [Pseudonocardia sp.]MDT7649113.1 raffinose/stachyose/melibiose transport system permease protein [Pseudonocardiales bacterium]